MSKRNQSQLFLTLDSLLDSEHPYRKLDDLLCFQILSKPFSKIYKFTTWDDRHKAIKAGLEKFNQ